MAVDITTADGRVLYTAEHADDIRAAVAEAVNAGANLRDADLSGVDLRGADLSGVVGVNPYLSTPLHILADQPGRIRAYKLVTADLVGPFNGGIRYDHGATVEAAHADTDPSRACAPGINVATLDWCLREWKAGYRILVVEFDAADIACIPTGSDGKFRLRRCTVVGEKSPADVGLAVEEPAV